MPCNAYGVGPPDHIARSHAPAYIGLRRVTLMPPSAYMETRIMSPSPTDVTQAILARHADEPGALLPILHDVQDALGHIPREVVSQIADGLNLSRAEVHG